MQEYEPRRRHSIEDLTVVKVHLAPELDNQRHAAFLRPAAPGVQHRKTGAHRHIGANAAPHAMTKDPEKWWLA